MNMRSFAVVGSVDHGKSSLCGQILFQCKHFTEHEVEATFAEASKNGMSRWKYAYLLDTLEEERRRGKTMESNEIKFSYNNQQLRMVDTPGHKHLIRKLITSIHNVRTGVLVISADIREFEAGFLREGQTREDLILLRALGVEYLIVAFNKMDLVNYDESRISSLKEKLQAFVSQLQFSHVVWKYISAYEGKGINELLDAIMEAEPDKEVEVVEEKRKQEQDTKIKQEKTITVNVKLITGTDVVVSSGYTSILHLGPHEYEVMFDKVKTQTGRMFGRTNDVIIAQLSCLDGKMFPLNQKDTTRIVLRNNDTTIGYGKLVSK